MNDRPTLPRLPRLPRTSAKTTRTASKQLSHEPTVNRREGGWGKAVWWEAADPQTAVGGTCHKCGRDCRAIDLKLHRTKDGDDIWKCAECAAKRAPKTPKTAGLTGGGR